MNLRHRSRSGDVQAAAAERLQALVDRLDRDRSTAVRRPQPRSDLGATPDAARPVSAGRHAARHAGAPRRIAAALRTGHHLAIVAIIVAIAAVVAGWHALRSTPEAVPVEVSGGSWARPVAASPSADAPAGDGSTSPDSAGGDSVVVDVTGRVRRPGIVELPAGSRVVDALEAAGGAKRSADTSTINLARVLLDGEQIIVGARGSPASGPAPVPATPTDPTLTAPAVNINTASAEELDTLPGVGPVTAAAIIQWRTDNGGFATVDDLLDVSGIGEATLEELKPFVLV